MENTNISKKKRRNENSKFLNNIEKKFGKREDILLCYGNWNEKQQMKHIAPTKGIGLRRIINKRFDIAIINEYKTSALCNVC